MQEMKKSSRKALKSFEKDYNAIVKSHISSTSQPWLVAGKGDAFVKFSMYKEEQTIATTNTPFQA
jgi:hypothetical protein